MSRLKPKAGLLMTEIEGEAVLLDMESSYYFSLNETGTRIWRGLEDGKTEAEIIEGLVAEFDVTREEAEQTTHAFLESLRSEGLVR